MKRLVLALLFVFLFVADTYAQSLLKVRVADDRRINVWLINHELMSQMNFGTA